MGGRPANAIPVPEEERRHLPHPEGSGILWAFGEKHILYNKALRAFVGDLPLHCMCIVASSSYEECVVLV